MKDSMTFLSLGVRVIASASFHDPKIKHRDASSMSFLRHIVHNGCKFLRVVAYLFNMTSLPLSYLYKLKATR